MTLTTKKEVRTSYNASGIGRAAYRLPGSILFLLHFIGMSEEVKVSYYVQAKAERVA
jgi:hypothetical protein